MRQVTEVATIDSACKSLYKVGGATALIMVVITLTQVVVFAISPPPYEGTAVDWFALFQKNALRREVRRSTIRALATVCLHRKEGSDESLCIGRLWQSRTCGNQAARTK
jgi:hypothetical protein